MNNNNFLSRRAAVKSSIFGILAVSIPNSGFSRKIACIQKDEKEGPAVFHRYPSIDDLIVAEVVGVSHFNLPRLKELVDKRPELSRATWDWAFGDWETALGAASHVGRRDIAQYLMSKGARPDIFTFAMLGEHAVVKHMIEAQPGIQSIAGPHGITLLQHAKNGLESEGISTIQKKNSVELISYLEGLGNADLREKYMEIEEAEKSKYVGDYRYGEGTADGFTVKINSRKMITFGKLGKNGGALYKKTENVFAYQGIRSVEIKFTVENNAVIALTIHEPDLTLTAKKI